MATIFQRGAVWRAQIRRKGHDTIARTFDTKADAEAWAEREEARLLAGVSVAQIRAMPSGVTVAALFARYAKEISPAKGGCRWEQIRLARLARDFDGIQATGLDGPAMAEWRDRRLKQVSAASVNRELALIGSVYTRAIKEWRLPLAANPVHQIMRPELPRPRTRRVSDAERATIIRYLGWDGKSEPKDIRQRIAWGFCLALETMMRQGEILRLTWQHVHLDRKFCHLPETKNGDARNVPLSSAAIALFGLLPRGPDTARVLPVNAGTFGIMFREAVTDAEIVDLHFHDTRREALTRASKKLSNVAELARASGHRELRSLMIYFQPDATDLADKLG
jgi:integrase